MLMAMLTDRMFSMIVTGGDDEDGDYGDDDRGDNVCVHYGAYDAYDGDDVLGQCE